MGDPKQLPATLFSRTARDVLLERSLFERMAQVCLNMACIVKYYCNADVHLLTLCVLHFAVWRSGEAVGSAITNVLVPLHDFVFVFCMQSGVAVKLLAVQYRMHPEIRSFPSKFFYDNALEDAGQVCSFVSLCVLI